MVAFARKAHLGLVSCTGAETSGRPPKPNAERPRAVVVDDAWLFRQEAAALLDELGVAVVGEAPSGSVALGVVARLRPDLVLVDLEMPMMGGLEATRRLRALPEPAAIIAVSIHDDGESRAASLASGAAAFVSKSELFETLPAVLETLFPSWSRRHRQQTP